MASPSRALAASFVVTVAAAPVLPGCQDGRGGGGRVHVSPPSLWQSPGGECRYAHGSSCPEGASCNPPPPEPVDCPPHMTGGPPRDPLAAARAGWVRIRESIGCYRGSCTFSRDYFCPEPGKTKGKCERGGSQKLAATEVPRDASPDAIPPGGSPGAHRVEAFVAQRAGGQCVAYPAFWYTPGGKLPQGSRIACGSPPPKPTAVIATAPSAAPISSASPAASAAPTP